MTPKVEAFGLSVCTCIRLRKAARRVSLVYDRHLEPFGLTITQYSLLAHLKTLDGTSIRELAETLIMDPTTLTRNLRPLERRDLLVMALDGRDRRARRLQLTAAGLAMLAKARPAWAEAQRHVWAAFGGTETRTLNTALDRLLERLTA